MEGFPENIKIPAHAVFVGGRRHFAGLKRVERGKFDVEIFAEALGEARGVLRFGEDNTNVFFADQTAEIAELAG